MTYREALTRATDQLSAHPALVATALPDASLLLMHLLRIDRATLIAHPEQKLERDQQAVYQRLIERRLAFEPIQYITGERDFYGMALKVTPAVLIPRPETEHLVEAVLARVDQQPLRIVDVGTGSGAIAIALARALPQASLTAVDLSSEALAVAAENAATHDASIRLVESDLLQALAHELPFDVIVSNPPYIPDQDAQALHPQVRDFEPAMALFGGALGTEFYARLIPQAHALLKPGGLLALEIGYLQQPAIAEMLAGWEEVEFLLDFQSIPRIALARRGL